MKYCIHCGKEIKETADFCTHCGKKQEGMEEEGAGHGNDSTNAVQGGIEAAEEPGGRMDGLWKYRKVAALALVLCAAVIVVINIGQIILRSGSGSGSRLSDEKVLKEIIANQKAMGASINDKNGVRYEWNSEGRLVGIGWSGCSLNGSISFSELTGLEWLNCEDNQLSSLDVEGCKKLKELYCGDNQLSKLDVRNCNKLETLSCGNNALKTLDVGNCVSMKYMTCNSNALKELDISNCNKLEALNCDEDVKISGCSVSILNFDN